MSQISIRESSHSDHDPWLAPFRSCIDAALKSDMRILDVGGGRRPILAPAERPPRCHYTGMDISARELSNAPDRSYDEWLVADITAYQPDLCASFDLIISWQVLEHVKSVEAAFANMRSYLRASGRVVLFFSGAFSAIALGNWLLPHRVGKRVVARIMDRPTDTVFPARYDKCHPRALRRILAAWTNWTIVPAWGGADYFAFFPAAQRGYVRYETWAQRRQHAALATHYLVTATK